MSVRTPGPALLCLALCATLAVPLFAQPARHETRDDFFVAQRRLIWQHFNGGRHFDCIAETRRLLAYQNLTPADRAPYEYFIDVNYFLGGQYRTVAAKAGSSDGRGSYSIATSILASQALYRLGRQDAALGELARWDYAGLTERDRREVFFRRSEILVRDYRYQQLHDEIAQARRHLPDSSSAPMSDALARHRDAGRKMPWLAAVMSAALPGSGQAYAGKYAAGLISLAAIAVTGYGGYHFHNRGEWNLAYTCGFFAALFYGGTVYGAYNAALNANRTADDAFNQAFIKNHLPAYRPASFMERQSGGRP